MRCFDFEASELLKQMESRGFRFHVEGDRLIVEPMPPHDDLERLKAKRDQLFELVAGGEAGWRTVHGGEVRLHRLERQDGTVSIWVIHTRDDRPGWWQAWHVRNETGDGEKVN